jgi:23S rRNA pseudouridine1911/1915/1917 synthase
MRHYSPLTAGRLDQTLASLESNFSRSFIQKMIKEGHVFVAHKKITKPAFKVEPGQEIAVMVPSLKEVGINPEKIKLDIVYEDKNCLIINKPAGMVVHPTDHGAHVTGTLVNAVMHHCGKELSGIGGVKRPGIVHRLDKDTSGLIIVAKNDLAHQTLSKQFETRTIDKKYVALVVGHLKPEVGSIEAPLHIAPGSLQVKISSHPDAKYALTHYEVKKYIETKDGLKFTLAEVKIVTGRTHQIRVHFASIHHPVVGDITYGNEKINIEVENKTGLSRQFLHAENLSLILPGQKKKAAFKADLPKDLKQCLKKLI